jgi:hypothetical protein
MTTVTCTRQGRDIGIFDLPKKIKPEQVAKVYLDGQEITEGVDFDWTDSDSIDVAEITETSVVTVDLKE